MPQRRRLRPQTPVCLRRMGLRPRLPRCYSPYYYNFVEFYSSAERVLLPLKKYYSKYSTSVLPRSGTYFPIQTRQFLLTADARIFLAPERRVP